MWLVFVDLYYIFVVVENKLTWTTCLEDFYNDVAPSHYYGHVCAYVSHTHDENYIWGHLFGAQIVGIYIYSVGPQFEGPQHNIAQIVIHVLLPLQ